MNLNNVVLILSGPVLEKNTLINNIKTYKSNNINNIIVSSYSDLNVSDLDVDFISNDIYYQQQENSIEFPFKNVNDSKYKIQYSEKDILPVEDYQNKYSIMPDMNLEFNWNKNNVNILLLTLYGYTILRKRALKLLEEKYKNCDYVFILRSDMFIPELHLKLMDFINIIENNKNSNSLFESKIITKFINMEHTKKYYLCDYMHFGTKNDILKFFSYNKLLFFNPEDNEYPSKRGYVEQSIIKTSLFNLNKNIEYDYMLKNIFYLYDFKKSIIWEKGNIICKDENNKKWFNRNLYPKNV